MSATLTVIRPSTIKSILRFAAIGLVGTPVLIGCVTLMAAGCLYLSWAASLLIGVVLVIPVLWTFIVVSMVLAIVRDVPRVEIGPDGFVLYQLGFTRSRAWKDVEGDFVLRASPFGSTVAYRLSELFKKSLEHKGQSGRPADVEFVGGCFAMSAVELAGLLNEHKRHAD